MQVFKNEFPVGAATRHICIKVELNFAGAFSHFVNLGKLQRDQAELQSGPIYEERYIAQHPLRVCLLLCFRDDAIRIGINACEHDGKHRNARGQTNLRLNTIFLHRDGCGLQILIQPVRGGRRCGQQQHRARSSQPRFHFAVGFRP